MVEGEGWTAVLLKGGVSQSRKGGPSVKGTGGPLSSENECSKKIKAKVGLSITRKEFT